MLPNRIRSDGGCDIYGAIRCVPIIVFIGVETQLPRLPVMRCRSTAGAGGVCYLFSSKFMRIRVG